MAFQAKSKTNNFTQNNNSKSRLAAKSLGKPMTNRNVIIINNGQIRISESANDKNLAPRHSSDQYNKSGTKNLAARNDTISNLRFNSSDSVFQFINKLIAIENNGLASYITSAVTKGNTISIPLSGQTATDAISAFINKTNALTPTIQLPAIPDPSNPAFAIQQTQEQAILDVLSQIITVQNPTIGAFLQANQTITTTGSIADSGIPIEDKVVAGATLPDEFTLNPFIDMAIDNPVANEVLLWNGTAWISGLAPLNISDLLDTTIIAPAPNDALIWNGSRWVNMPVASGGPLAIEGLSNVSSAVDPNNNSHALVWDNIIKQWVNRQINYSDIGGIPPATGATDLDGLSDVIIGPLATNQILKYNGSFFINTTFGNIDILDDVIVTAPVANQILLYNGTHFVNTNIKELLNLTDLLDTSVTTPISGQVLQYNGTQWINTTLPTLGQYLTWYVTDTKTIGNYGGIATIGVWTARTLNTVNVNSGVGVTLAADQLTMAAGNYNIDINVPFFRTGVTKIRLRNITDSATLAESNGMIINDGATLNISTYISLIATKIVEIQYYVTASIDNSDLGVPMGIDNEMYTTIRISRLLSSMALWHYTDVKTIGNVGGAATINTWTTRQFNNINANGGSEITLFASAFTIMPGSYHIDIVASFYKTKHTKLRFRNITTNQTVYQSTNTYSCEDATIKFSFNLDATVTNNYEIQYYVTNSDSNIDLGVPVGEDQEVYASARFTKF